jgi:hypothetical protein
VARKQKQGWYPDPQNPGQQRWWDGETWTEQTQMAPPTRKKRRGGTFLKVVLGVVLGGLILIGGCIALVGAGLSSEETDGITRSQFDSIEQGTEQSEIEDKHGEPEDAQEFESEIPELQDQPSRSSCIYYPEKGKPILEGQSFQLCFDDGKLTSKNAY